ncbi:MAG: methyltransferase domain-containing protein, partial [Alphaproteobacteria bacterium]|nr:methyltransferase domain-containing protein [Alphaproteobacteria bacterium]
IRSVLLAGEGAEAKAAYASVIGASPDIVVTAGLHDDADHRWDFEDVPPEIEGFQCVVSHAMLEHLVDPYRHMRDLGNLLAPGGQLVVYTVTPGFPYHRHPVDCMRFFPDWFEEVGKRMELMVQDRFIGDDHIVYRYLKP